MEKTKNWFRLILDRKTHNAKFRLYTGTGQEINLQIQSELEKSTKQVNKLLNHIDQLEEVIAGQTNEMELLRDIVSTKDTEIADREENVLRTKQNIQVMKQMYTQQLKEQMDNALADIVPNNPKCALLRVEIIYDQYNDAGTHMYSHQVATTIDPRQKKNEIAIRLRSLFAYLKASKPK